MDIWPGLYLSILMINPQSHLLFWQGFHAHLLWWVVMAISIFSKGQESLGSNYLKEITIFSLISALASKMGQIKKNQRHHFILHTSENSFYKWIKLSTHEMTILELKKMMKRGLDFFIFWNLTCPFRVATAQCKKIGLAG